MAENDIVNAATDATYTPAAPLKTSGDWASAEGGTLSDAKHAIKDNAGKLQTQAADKVRTLADTGKEKASGTLEQFSSLITDAAAQVDDKLGSQYGDYARSAANTVSGLSETLRNKDVDELVEDARALISKSPVIAIGIAAAVGFVVARVVQSGIDVNEA